MGYSDRVREKCRKDGHEQEPAPFGARDKVRWWCSRCGHIERR